MNALAGKFHTDAPGSDMVEHSCPVVVCETPAKSSFYTSKSSKPNLITWITIPHLSRSRLLSRGATVKSLSDPQFRSQQVDQTHNGMNSVVQLNLYAVNICGDYVFTKGRVIECPLISNMEDRLMTCPLWIEGATYG